MRPAEEPPATRPKDRQVGRSGSDRWGTGAGPVRTKERQLRSEISLCGTEALERLATSAVADSQRYGFTRQCLWSQCPNLRMC